MRPHSLMTGAGSALLLTAAIGAAVDSAAIDSPIRIGVVDVQDRSTTGAGYDEADAVLARLLRAEGLQSVPLSFQPPADVEYAARRAECDYILYTDIVAVRKTARSQFTKALRMISGIARPRVMAYADDGPTVAEIEFRLFAMTEVLPRISTTITSTSGKAERRQSSATMHRPERAALAGALAREVRMIRAEVRANKAAAPEF